SADKFLDADDALRDDCGYGGRIDGAIRYRFTYLSGDGVDRWTIVLDELELRAIADGLQIEAEAEHDEVIRTQRRTPTGEPLLIWGAYNDDALLIQSPGRPGVGARHAMLVRGRSAAHLAHVVTERRSAGRRGVA